MKRVQNKLQEVAPDQNDSPIGLGSLAKGVLNHWDKLWDWDDAYNIMISVVYCEVPLGKIDPFFAIKMLQTMENQYIMEALAETDKFS